MRGIDALTRACLESDWSISEKKSDGLGVRLEPRDGAGEAVRLVVEPRIQTRIAISRSSGFKERTDILLAIRAESASRSREALLLEVVFEGGDLSNLDDSGIRALEQKLNGKRSEACASLRELVDEPPEGDGDPGPFLYRSRMVPPNSDWVQRPSKGRIPQPYFSPEPLLGPESFEKAEIDELWGFGVSLELSEDAWSQLDPEQAHEGGELNQSLAPRHFRKCSTNDSGAPPRFRKHLHHKALAHFIHLTRLFWD